MAISDPLDHEFFAGTGEVAKLMRELDWSKTPLGDSSSWPQSLRTTVRIVLTSRFAMWMAWGPELTCLYNDSYRQDTLGIKHPWALGASARKVWAEIWPEIGPLVEQVMETGEATWQSGMMLFLERSGFREETYHTFSYQPIADDTGRVNGMLCVVSEETERIIGERRMALLRDIGSQLAGAHTEELVMSVMRTCLAANAQDAPFTLTYLLSESGENATLCSSTYVDPDSSFAQRLIEINQSQSGPWPLHDALLDRSIVQISELKTLIDEVPCGPWSDPASEAVIVPIAYQGQEKLAGFFIAGVNPYRPLDEEYRGFYELIAGQMAAALANARAYEAERKRVDELAKLDHAKTAFFSNVSHELRTPLTLILGPLEEQIKNSETNGSLEIAHRNALRLLKLVNSLLDFSRIEAGRTTAHFQPTDLSKFTAELTSNFASAIEKTGLELIVETPPLREAVYVDREMWEKIVLNLVSNALKHTFEGSIKVEVKEFGEQAILRVSDTGSGIPEEELPKIFDRFHRVENAERRTHEGTGIGLSLVQELVRLHEGSIIAASELGSGSTFEVAIPLGFVHLPLESVSQANSEASGDVSVSRGFVEEAMGWIQGNLFPETSSTFGIDSNPSRSTARIVLADDNPDMRSYLQRLLETRYIVEPVADGLEALRAIERNRPDLVLTDAMMPRMDGFELVRQIRDHQDLSDLPVIMLSARAGEESKLEGLEKGVDDYIVKPFAAQELMARVQSILMLTQARRESSIRERVLREEAEDARGKLDFVLRRMHDIVAVVDADWHLVYASESAASLTGLSREQLMGEVAWNLFPSLADSSVSADLHETMETGVPLRRDYWMELFHRHLEFRAEKTPDGGLAVVAIDVTHRVENEKELERRVAERTAELLEANRELEGFTYTVSHDLRTPLRAIVYNSSLLIADLGTQLADEHRTLLERQVAAARKVAALIDDLLKLSRLSRQELHKGEIDLTEIARNGAQELRESGYQSIEFEVEPNLRCHADPNLLHLVLFNLLENASKFSPKGGTVHLGKWSDSPQTFFVKDEGIGFENEYAAKIFEPFERLVRDSEFPGTGIGLANVKRIIERHGGKVWAQGSLGQGATIFFELA